MNNTGIPRSNTKLHNGFSQGFTLVELMVVIVIVGIMFSFLTLSIRSDSPEEAIKKEAQRLNQLIQIALEEAILRGEEYAIVFKPNSYQFAHLTGNGWKIIANDRLLRPRELPFDITIELEVEQTSINFSTHNKNQNNETGTVEPQVFLLSSGEITPEFTVSMLILGVETSYQIVGKINGQHSATSNAY